MRAIRIIALTALTLTLTSACALRSGPASDPAPAPVPMAAHRAQAAQALLLGGKVADWQLSHMDRFDYTRTHLYNTVDPRGWIQGAMFTGVAAFAERTGELRYAEAIRAHGRAQTWQLGRRPLHADDHVIGQVWLWAHGRDRDPAQIAALRLRFDAILASPPTEDLAFQDGVGEPPCQTRWCWSDALFMAPATWTGLTAATGDPRYAAYADKEFWAATDYLLDPEEGLYFRDSRYIDRRDDKGRKIFWSRGNGWAFAGIANVLKTLPADHPSRPRYEALLRRMAARLVQIQKPDGYWSPSLLSPEGSPPETSGTGFFVYGLAYGVNHGLLKGPEYQHAVDLGWAALAAAVQADGKLGWVQQVGYAPDQVEPDDTQLYGVGAFLLAASEVGAR